MIFLSAQPDDYYFIWQLELQIANFHSLGIPKEKIHILLGFDQKRGLQQHIKKFVSYYSTRARIFIYADERLSRVYASSIRPHLIGKHFEKFPNLQEEAIFYHDSDIIFRELPDFEKLSNGNKWFASNIQSYLGYDYLYHIGGKMLIEGMAKIIGIDSGTVKDNDNHVGGAQYLLKDLDAAFWREAEKKCEELFIFLENFNARLRERALIAGKQLVIVQSWCTDMWVLLWCGWKRGAQLEVIPELDFCWPQDPISEWNNCHILHYSGVHSSEDKTVFRKGSYLNYSPIYDDDIRSISSDNCSAPMRDLILRNRDELEKRRIELSDITVIIDLLAFGNSYDHNIDVIVRYLICNIKVAIVVIAYHDIPESLKGITDLCWVALKKQENHVKKILTHAIKTDRACLYPPLLIDAKEICRFLLTEDNSDYLTCICETVLYVDPFFQVLVDKLRDIKVLSLHQEKFQPTLPSFDPKIHLGLKEKIIDAIMTQNGSSDRSVIKHRIEYGYKFFTPLNRDDKLTALKPAAEELKDMTIKEDLVMKGRKKCTSGKIRTTDPNCWLESTIGRIWIQFHNGSKEVASQHFSMLLDGLDEVDDIAFTSGLVGIGFGIESLSQRHILDIDSNIVLEDFDNLFYSSYLFGNKEEIGLHNGMAGKLLYLSLRNRNQNSHKNTHRFRSLIHHECLQLILDQIVGYWPLPKIALEKYAMIDICQLMIIFSSIATHEKISSGSLLRIIENYSFYFLAMFNKASNEISLETGCCSYLLWQCNKIVGDLYFMGHFSEQYAKFSSQLLCNGQENFGILAFDKEAIFQYLDGHTASHFRKLEVELKNTVFLKLIYNAV